MQKHHQFIGSDQLGSHYNNQFRHTFKLSFHKLWEWHTKYVENGTNECGWCCKLFITKDYWKTAGASQEWCDIRRCHKNLTQWINYKVHAECLLIANTKALIAIALLFSDCPLQNFTGSWLTFKSQKPDTYIQTVISQFKKVLSYYVFFSCICYI